MFLDIIDRRKNPKGKSLVNRRRYLKRHSKEVKEAVQEKINESGIKDIATETSKRVNIPIRETEEPVFRHDEGGVRERVLPGNKEFVQGDTIPRPQAGQGQGTEGSPDGEGEDDFAFELSQEEFMEYFFDGLELPDMVKKVLTGEQEFKMRRAGYATDGTPNNLDAIRTLRQSHARRLAFRMPKLKRKRALEAERAHLEQQCAEAQSEDARILREQIEEIDRQIEVLERQIKAIPFLDEVDVRYRRHERVPVPVSQAVMFCMMDVSGSMGPWHKEMSKRFYILLYLFLTRNYDKVDVVFIRHHHTAQEVDEETFFTSRESGGTVVSTAMDLMRDIARERYPTSQWNIYACHASDGDNFLNDNAKVYDRLMNDIMPIVQYYAYVEVDKQDTSQLWQVYEDVHRAHEHFAMARITDAGEIFPVFRGLFERQGEGVPNG